MQASTQAAIPGLVAKFKVFRFNSGTTYDFVAEQSFTPPSNLAWAKHTVTLNPPILVQMGDVPGAYLYSALLLSQIGATSLPAWDPHTLHVAGDHTSQTNFTSNHTSHVSWEWFMYQPYLAVTGDSIPAGHNGATNWHSGLCNGENTPIPGGTITSEIMNQLRGKIGGGSSLQYQNLALGSQGFAYVAATGIVNCVAVKPHTILIHAGINDILTDRAWADVLANLATIKAAITTERLLIDEILPCTNASDARAANIRTFNTNLAAWCTANGAILIPCWAAFGQLRAATGYNDNLLTAYSQDGTHLSAAGVDKLASIWVSYI
jgi:lysophospholipase L1-like esterase